MGLLHERTNIKQLSFPRMKITRSKKEVQGIWLKAAIFKTRKAFLATQRGKTDLKIQNKVSFYHFSAAEEAVMQISFRKAWQISAKQSPSFVEFHKNKGNKWFLKELWQHNSPPKSKGLKFKHKMKIHMDVAVFVKTKYNGSLVSSCNLYFYQKKDGFNML